MLACLSRHPSSRRVRAKRSREGVPAFCTMPIIHSVQYIFAMFSTLRMNGPLEYVGQYRWFNPSFYPSLCRISMARRPHQREDPTMTLPKVDPTMTLSPYIHGEKTSKAPKQAATSSWYFVTLRHRGWHRRFAIFGRLRMNGASVGCRKGLP